MAEGYLFNVRAFIALLVEFGLVVCSKAAIDEQSK
jgi:hypothetical protein